MASKRNLPPLEYRMVFYMGMRRQKCRFNQSLDRFLELPAAIRDREEKRYRERHPRMNLPEFEVSRRPTKKVKR